MSKFLEEIMQAIFGAVEHDEHEQVGVFGHCATREEAIDIMTRVMKDIERAGTISHDITDVTSMLGNALLDSTKEQMSRAVETADLLAKMRGVDEHSRAIVSHGVGMLGMAMLVAIFLQDSTMGYRKRNKETSEFNGDMIMFTPHERIAAFALLVGRALDRVEEKEPSARTKAGIAILKGDMFNAPSEQTD